MFALRLPRTRLPSPATAACRSQPHPQFIFRPEVRSCCRHENVSLGPNSVQRCFPGVGAVREQAARRRAAQVNPIVALRADWRGTMPVRTKHGGGIEEISERSRPEGDGAVATRREIVVVAAGNLPVA